MRVTPSIPAPIALEVLKGLIAYQMPVGVWWLSVTFGALRPESHGFKFHSSSYAGTLGKSFTHSCL